VSLGPIEAADLQVAMLSRIGGRERNEDACGYLAEGGPACFVLSDGAGGHGGGDVAARTAVGAVLERFAARPRGDALTVAALIDAAQAAVRDAQQGDPACADMRATLVVLLIDPVREQAVWGHVGDSRLYGFRDGHVAVQTRDHSLYESMVAAGLADERDRRNNPERNVLLASLGSDEAFAPEVTQTPYPLRPGDALLLCSDGFWDYVTEPQMEGILQRVSTVDQWLAEMAELVAGRGHRSQDNYSAVGIWFGRGDFDTRLLPGATQSPDPGPSS
jgi:serine/threonine protein phosphatase PrpC